ncbi:MAG: hypothetical protein L3J67_12495 [Hyphomicrobiaceae bacterium]|nr:hypothetical protein [Hyphomicrobiaceae bacterium]
MTRVMIFDVLLFLTPFVVYAFWKWLFHGARGHKEIMGDAPILVLVLVGSVLGMGGLYFLASHEQEGPQAHYSPPRMNENGQIEPGHFEPDAQMSPKLGKSSRR